MLKQILLIALLVAGFWLFRRFRQRRSLMKSDTRPYQEMVRCAHCGVYIPRSEAIDNRSRDYFCSEEHRLAGPEASDKGSG